MAAGAQRCILSSALRGLKVFPTATHYGITLTGCDCNDNNRKKKQVSDIKKLCSGAFPLSVLNPSIVNMQGLLKPRLEQFPSINRRIFAIVDGTNALRHDVLTFPIPYDEEPAAPLTVVKKPCTVDQCVQTDPVTSTTDADASCQPSDLKELLDGIKGDLHNMNAIELYEQGREREALLKWKLASELGSLDALYNLGTYWCAWRKPISENRKDYEKGAKFFIAAMRRGHVKSKYLLGAMHMRNYLDHSDPDYGFQLVKESAMDGYPEARFFMGLRNLRNENYAEAETYFKDIMHKKTYRTKIQEWLSVPDIPDQARHLFEKLLV